MQVSNSIHFSKTVWLNSKGQEVNPKTHEKHIDDAIGNNPNNAIDFVDDTGQRVTLSKKVFMGILNSVYHMDTSISKQDFVEAAADAGLLTDGLAHPISKSEFLAYMNKHDDAPAVDANATSNTLYKVGGKLTKEELLALIKKSVEEKKAKLESLSKPSGIGTARLLKTKEELSKQQVHVDFMDQKTSKTISLTLDKDLKKQLEKSVPNLQNYLQTMYTLYKEAGNVDSNNDGYLDAKELISSKRFVKENVGTSENINFSISSLKDIIQNKDKAVEMMGYILKDMGHSDGKISINKDFLAFISVDTNRDTHMSDKEIFKDIGGKPTSATFKNFLLEQILAMIKKNKDKVLGGLQKI